MRTRWALALILILTVVPRLAQLPVMRESNMSPDTAHFLNVARCLQRDQGLSNPAAWPAWLQPARLPMPDTWKEPGYPWLMARFARAGIDPFRAGQAVSLIAGILFPFAVWLLGRQLAADPLVALLAALMAAGSPELVDKSVSALSESLFGLFVALTFLCAAWRLREPGRANRPLVLDVLTGALFGACHLLRSQALLALPALAALISCGRPLRRSLAGSVLAAVTALAVLSPFIVRNLRLFGVPFYSDAWATGMWAYADPIMLSHGVDRPPELMEFALEHPREVLAHQLWSLKRFLIGTLPRQLYGNPIWVLACAVGLYAVRRQWRDWLFVVLYAGISMGAILTLSWEPRYFVSSMSAWCLLAAAGANWAARTFDENRNRAAVARGLPPRREIAAVLVLVLAAIGPLVVTLRQPGRVSVEPALEIAAARHYTPFLRSRLARDEAVMVETTSYWAWFVDRPVVHLVIADSTRFLETVHRLKVRWAVLPTRLLPTLASHYPDHRLPAALVLDREDTARGVTLYRVMEP
ncbi:MAG TPA: glycosyltransferase family 39 protein [Candidatus Limnocylindria bacterium]|nr:glycosyltransferase family 39 protein [Candidatus Limnocylindria bacterium]